MKHTEISRNNLDEFLDCAANAARTAGLHALDHNSRRKDILLASAHDVKLKLDRECQVIAEAAIRARFPDHAILGEESAVLNAADSGLVWIIDPIDGTVNFFHGLPLWCCSIALLDNGKTIAGAVYAPVLDELYTARADGDASCNGKKIIVSGTRRLEDAIVATGIDRKTRDLSQSMRLFERLTAAIQRPRIMGAAALDICHVACGKTDGYHESGIFLWDAAAGGLIVERAGGKAEILRRAEGLQVSFMASNGHIHEQFKQLLTA